jgi:asparagine synthase (glutamine-hydrolysing)
MSAIGAIFNFNERPLEPEPLVSLWNGLAGRGPDGGNFVLKRSLGLCYRAFHTNRESRLEKQPLVSADGRILTADLRIDNREELITQLKDLLHGERTEITDVQIALAAHQRWGDMFPAHMIGEYALILWNPADRTVLMARDHMGARTLYYHKNKESLICSSELSPLLNVAVIPVEINDEYIAGYLGQSPEPWLTPYKHIHACF